MTVCVLRRRSNTVNRRLRLFAVAEVVKAFLQFGNLALQGLHLFLEACNRRFELLHAAIGATYALAVIAKGFLEDSAQFFDFGGKRFDSRKQFRASGLKSLGIYFGVDDNRAVSLSRHK